MFSDYEDSNKLDVQYEKKRTALEAPPVVLSNTEKIQRPPWFALENVEESQILTTRNIKPEDYAETKNKDVEEIRRLKEENNILNKILRNIFPEKKSEQKDIKLIFEAKSSNQPNDL